MKKTSIIKRAGRLTLSALVALVMCSAGAYAAGTSGAYDSDSTDYNLNGTGNNTMSRQDNAGKTTWGQNAAGSEEVLIGSDSGVVTLGKILTVNQANKFPNVEDFVYRVTPVSAWDNANIDTKKSGETISRSNMPRPTSGTANADHHQVASKGSGENWYSLVTIGNFKNSAENNASAVTNSDAASNTAGISDNLRRTRTTDLKFTFRKAGYYMYRVEEVGSIRNGTSVTGSSVTLAKDVAGVDYDNNTYYIVFYVANQEAAANSTSPAPDKYGHGTKIGDTIGQEANGGIYVHTITSWTNSQSSDQKAADLQDGQALDNAKDLMNAMDNGGQAAKPNTGRVDGNNNGVTNESDPAKSNGSGGGTYKGPGTVTHDNPGKVGVSLPPAPNKLEAYRMWNAQTTHDVTLKKNITGNLGDRTKAFEFTVVLTGLENDQMYTTNAKAEVTNDETSSGVFLYNASAGAVLYEADGVTENANAGKSFRASASGTATFQVRLKDDEMLVINALPRSASYTITEAASDHVARYDIVSTNPSVSAVTDAEKAVVIKGSDANARSNQTLSTAAELVDRYDGTVTVRFQNNRDLATITGVPGLDYGVYTAILAVLALAVCAILRRRRLYADESCES